MILIGGRLYKHSIVTVGAAAIEGIDNIHADLFFMGLPASIQKRGLLPAISKRRASNVHFPAGPPRQWSGIARKINTASSFVIGELSLANTIVVEDDTDRGISAVREKGVSVVTTSDPE